MVTVAAPLTAEEFARITSTTDVPLELVRGEIVEMNRPGSRHGFVCLEVGARLREWAKQGLHGHVVTNDAGIVIARGPDTIRGPDVYFVRRDRLPHGLPVGWLEIPPELCVEVLSPSDEWSNVLAKTGEYLGCGVRRVWVVDPETRRVHVFRPDGPPTERGPDDVLDDADVLPGFAVHVKELFE